jgi:hypothetical protein
MGKMALLDINLSLRCPKSLRRSRLGCVCVQFVDLVSVCTDEPPGRWRQSTFAMACRKLRSCARVWLVSEESGYRGLG